MIKKAVHRSSWRRVRGEDHTIPAIKTVAPDLPLDVLRNMDIRVDPWSAPHVHHRTPLRIHGALNTTCEAGVSAPRTPKRVARTGIVAIACSALKGRLICWRMYCPRRVGRGTAAFFLRTVGVVVRATAQATRLSTAVWFNSSSRPCEGPSMHTVRSAHGQALLVTRHLTLAVHVPVEDQAPRLGVHGRVGWIRR